MVKVRVIQNALDVLERELQLSKQQNGLQPRQRCIVIQPVTCFCAGRGRQQADGIIVVQRPDADTGQLADFVNGHHGYPSSV